MNQSFVSYSVQFFRRGILLACGWSLLNLQSMALPQTLTFREATASYRSRDVLSAWVGKTNQVTGMLVYDNKTGVVLEGNVQVQLSTIDSGNSLRDTRMRNEFLQTEQYPTATFKIKSVEGFAKFTEWKKWGLKERGKIIGELTVRAITRPVVFEGEAVYTGRELQLKGTGVIKMSDFGITPPSLLLVTVEDNVTLDITAVATGPYPPLTPTINK